MALTETQILDALRQVDDPEMGINIVDLGLVYSVTINGGTVEIKMTLTMRGCPMHDSIIGGVRLVVLNLEDVDDVAVELVWDPPWSPSMMTPEARSNLG